MGIVIFFLLTCVLAYYFFNRKKVICKDCGFVGKLKKNAGGNLLIEIILWCCFLIPGIIYSIWSMSSRKYTCPSCTGHSLIPTDSPIGKQLSNKSSTAFGLSEGSVQSKKEEIEQPYKFKKNDVFIGLGILVFCCYVVWSVSSSITPAKDISSNSKKSTPARGTASEVVVKKSSEIEKLLTESEEKYNELCSEKTNGECLYLANHTKNKKIKRLLSVQICLHGEVDNDMESCGLFAFLENDMKTYYSIIQISCEEKGNLKDCVSYAFSLMDSKDESAKKQGKELLTKLCSDGLKRACKAIKN